MLFVFKTVKFLSSDAVVPPPATAPKNFFSSEKISQATALFCELREKPEKFF